MVSVGGDGMLSSLAGLVSAAGGTLGVVPAGRGNDFARMLGLPSDPAEVAALLLDGEVRKVDLLALALPGAEPRLVAGSVYSGVDARAGEIVDRAHRLPRKAQYPYAALRALATYQPGPLPRLGRRRRAGVRRRQRRRRQLRLLRLGDEDRAGRRPSPTASSTSWSSRPPPSSR